MTTVRDGAMILRYPSGIAVEVGDVVGYRGESYVVTGGRAPQHPASTGRIYVRSCKHQYQDEYFPGVFNCQWEDAK